MSILLNLDKLLTTISSFLYATHNKVVWGYIGFTPSVRPSVPYAMSTLWLVAYFHKYYGSVYSPSMLVVLVRRNQRVYLKLLLFSWGRIPTMSDNFDTLGTSAMERSLHMFDACSHFRANLDTHDMCALCRARAGDKLCTTEDNCIACTSWDDTTWNMFEVNSLAPGRFKWNLDE